MPDSRSISSISSELSGVIELGLRITLLPAASAGMQSPQEFAIGKLHGPITPTTPTGAYRMISLLPATTGLFQAGTCTFSRYPSASFAQNPSAATVSP